MRGMAKVEYLTTAELATELRLHPETIRRWINDGKLPALRLSVNNYRITRSDADQLLATMRTSTTLVVGQ